MFEDLGKFLISALHLIDSFHLPVLKTRAIEFTDAGLGVGVGNFEGCPTGKNIRSRLSN